MLPCVCSMLQCVCSVVDHRGRQNVVRTSVTHSHWTDARQHGIYLFYTIKKHTTSAFYYNIFLNYSKAGLCPLWQTRTKVIWHNLLSTQNEAISLVAMHNKELWLVKKNHVTIKLDSNDFSWNERKQNLQMLKKMLENHLSFVIRAALSLCAETAWMFPWILLELKEYARKTCGCGQHWTVTVFILTEFKKWWFYILFLTSICVNNYFNIEFPT